MERKVFKPKPDEVGIVFEDDTPIDIDVLAYRTVRNRKYLLIAECKDRPRRKVSISDLELLLRKSEFVKKKYSRIAEELGEHKPVIEEIWFITTGDFTDDAKNFAKENNIKLINKKL